MGWGEFEIQIKVFFVDNSEKPFTIFHFLSLYPAEGTTSEPGQIPGFVTAEQYDEIVRL